jgi:hypothetical protein
MASRPSSHQVVFRYSRVKTIAWLVFIAVMATASLSTGLMMAFVIGPLAYIFTALGALLFAALARYHWRQLRDRAPVLVMNAAGMVDRRIGAATIPWQSLKQIDHSTLRSSQVMALTFVDSAKAEAIFGASQQLNAISLRLQGVLVGLRPHAALELSSLEGSPRRAVKIAQALHARATRRASPAGITRPPRPPARAS